MARINDTATGLNYHPNLSAKECGELIKIAVDTGMECGALPEGLECVLRTKMIPDEPKVIMLRVTHLPPDDDFTRVTQTLLCIMESHNRSVVNAIEYDMAVFCGPMLTRIRGNEGERR